MLSGPIQRLSAVPGLQTGRIERSHDLYPVELPRYQPAVFNGSLALLSLLLLGVLLCFTCAASAQTSGDSVEVPGHSSLLLKAKGTGAQVYSCTQGKWVLQGPDANLLNSTGEIIGHHFAGPTWKLNDGSWVKAKTVAKRGALNAESVPWLLLESVGGAGSLANVRYIQRTETHGGNAPSGSCRENAEVRVNYSATYSFYAVKP